MQLSLDLFPNPAVDWELAELIASMHPQWDAPHVHGSDAMDEAVKEKIDGNNYESGNSKI